jgi:uncharacterized membrane protein YbaN (DUF454 family)
VWIVIGSVFVVLAAVGVVLPVLPTTPFLLLAAACYGRGSPRLHAWLLQQRLFGPTIRTWQASRALPTGVKLPAVVIVLVTFGASMLAVDVTELRIMLAVLCAALVVFLVRLPVVDLGSVALAGDPEARSTTSGRS